MLVEMVLEDIRRRGLPEEARDMLVKLYAYAVAGKAPVKPRSLREEEERLPEKPHEKVPKWVRLAVARELPGILVEVPYRLLGGREKDFSPEEEERVLRLLGKELTPFQIAVLFLWEEYAESGLPWEALEGAALARLGEEAAWKLLLEEARERLQAKGLAPKEKRFLA